MPQIQTPPTLPTVFSRRAGDIAATFADPRYAQAAMRCQRRYLHWHRVRFIARADGIDPELLWARIKLVRQPLLRELPLKDAGGRPLTYSVPDAVQQELMLTDQQLAGFLTIGDDVPITESQKERFIIGSLMEEAIASSQLEGASTIHRVAKEMLRRNRAPRDRSERMIVNNYRAIMFMRDQADTALSTEMLIELQRILTDGTLDDPGQCGRLRTDSDNVTVEDQYGEELHLPPPASTLPDRLRGLCDFANARPVGDSVFIHPVIRAIALHFQLGYDHPFCDGNGRTARALFYWSMLRSGYWLFEFLPISRLIYRGPGKYARAFQYVETDDFDLTYFLDYHARIIAMARNDLRDYLALKRQEVRSARDAFGSLEVNDRQRAVLLDALGRPRAEYTIEEHQTRNGISYFTARADLLGLESLGFMKRRRSGKKYVFTPTPLVRERAHADARGTEPN